MKSPPGVMLYFTLRPCLKRLALAEKGALFEAILDYAQDGVLPEFDGVLGVAWDFVQPHIDADAAAYQQKCEQAKKAIDSRWEKHRRSTGEYERIPPNTEDTNISNNSSNNSMTSSKPNSTSESSATGESEGGGSSPLTKSMPNIERLDDVEFERRRQEQILRLRQLV